MKSGLAEKDCENLAIELIRILQKWGLWTDVTIFTNGNRYKHSYEKKTFTMVYLIYRFPKT